ncbi:MAG: Na+/H+ antiporter subunit G [bacterium]
MSPAMVDYLLEMLVSLMVLAGAGFTLVGSIGLLRLDDVFQRMHAPTKATTLGVGLVLAASVLSTWTAQRELSLNELLVALLLFVTAPVSAYLVARVALHRRPCAQQEDADRR